jgi:hypothetical protein
MFARMATFSLTDPTAVEEMNERIDAAVRPIVEPLAGWRGVTQLLDREGGRMLVIHFFDTRENMEAAEPTFEEMPQRFDQSLREYVGRVAGGRQSVERFEVVSEERAAR